MSIGVRARWVQVLVPAALACAIAACSHDLDELFVDEVSDAGPSASAQPWLPAKPDDDRINDCTACAQRECVQERSDCLEDDACTALLECKSECWHPACLAECEAEHGFSAWYEDLSLCTFGSCSTDCGAGQNWGCVDHYDWPPAESARFEVTVRFDVHPAVRSTDSLVAVGARARYCPDDGDFECGFGSPSARVDATNAVTLEVQANFGDGAATGWFELESSSAGFYGFRDRVYGQPLFRSAIVRAYPSTALFYRGAAGGWLDLDGSWLATIVADCVGWPALGVRHSLPDHPGVDPCHVGPGGELCDSDGEGSFAFIELDAATLEEPLRVQVERADTSVVVAERLVHGRPAWRTRVTLFPRSREQ